MREVSGVLARFAARLGTPLRAWPRTGGVERRDRGGPVLDGRLSRRCRLTRRCGWAR
jgi:hypothetical protein